MISNEIIRHISVRYGESKLHKVVYLAKFEHPETGERLSITQIATITYLPRGVVTKVLKNIK